MTAPQTSGSCQECENAKKVLKLFKERVKALEKNLKDNTTETEKNLLEKETEKREKLKELEKKNKEYLEKVQLLEGWVLHYLTKKIQKKMGFSSTRAEILRHSDASSYYIRRKLAQQV